MGQNITIMIGCCYQVRHILKVWRGTQADQSQLQQSFIRILKGNQIMEDCNELIADIENAFEAGNIDVSVAKNQIHV